MTEKMSMETFNAMTNTERVEYLNNYVGKTKQFQEDNEFSWTYATNHCEYVKEGSMFVPKEEVSSNVFQEVEEDWSIIKQYRNGKKVQKYFRFTEVFVDELKSYAKTHGMTDNELALCAIKKYMNANK